MISETETVFLVLGSSALALVGVGVGAGLGAVLGAALALGSAGAFGAGFATGLGAGAGAPPGGGKRLSSVGRNLDISLFLSISFGYQLTPTASLFFLCFQTTHRFKRLVKLAYFSQNVNSHKQ
ncbi:MAG: hypothetical protein ACOYUZ_05850 [Patescibacteria group bacterium]